ncbi:MAG: hypothetical protein ACOZQL_00670 [Myxococcota bacterium]
MRALLSFLMLFAACARPQSLDDGGAAPRCTVTDEAVTCAPRIDTVDGRDVYWQQPVGAPPERGWPVVLVFQGSFFGPSSTWNTVPRDLAFGGYHQAKLQAALLEQGFTVIAPSALAGIAWQTNTGTPWELTFDRGFIEQLLAAMDRGDFGPIDPTRRYATGISSGGYMTSRMALSYAGKFRALAIQSASWATCAGLACALPATLPGDHPPTRLLHGRGDLTVPLSTAEAYAGALVAEGHVAELVVDDTVGHQWLPAAPELIVDWFQTH